VALAAPHADVAWAADTGLRIARFLGVYLENRLDPEESWRS
jgi:hypothetical protein